MVNVQFFTLSGKFGVQQEREFSSEKEAMAAAKEHAAASNYTNVRVADDASDCDECGYRIIADPPVGRKGRNIAQVDLY